MDVNAVAVAVGVLVLLALAVVAVLSHVDKSVPPLGDEDIHP